MNRSVFRNSKKSKTFLTILFAVISIIYILPIVTVLINSFKANAYINTETFALPTEESYVLFAGSSVRPYHAPSQRYALFIHRQTGHHLSGYGYGCHLARIPIFQQYSVIVANGIPPVHCILLRKDTSLCIVHRIALFAMG